MTLAPDDAGRHNLSPLPQRRRVARSGRGVDAPQEEGDAAEPENSDGENISVGDGDGDDGGADGGARPMKAHSIKHTITGRHDLAAITAPTLVNISAFMLENKPAANIAV